MKSRSQVGSWSNAKSIIEEITIISLAFESPIIRTKVNSHLRKVIIMPETLGGRSF